jgi:hypothetical protein
MNEAPQLIECLSTPAVIATQQRLTGMHWVVSQLASVRVRKPRRPCSADYPKIAAAGCKVWSAFSETTTTSPCYASLLSSALSLFGNTLARCKCRKNCEFLGSPA